MDVPIRAKRGETAIFEAEFYEDVQTKTVPVVPRDPTQYPSVTIYAPDTQQVFSGVARKITPGTWRFDFPTPADAPFSSESQKWRAEWVLYAGSGRLWQKTILFDVIEQKIPTPEDRQRTLMVTENTSARVSLRRQADPFSLSANLYHRAGDTQMDLIASFAYEPGAASSDPTNPAPAIKRVDEAPDVVFYLDTPPLMAGEYVLLWEERSSLTAPLVQEPRTIRVTPLFAVILMDDLRILIDKLAKKPGRLQAYDPAELYSYILRGVDILNSYHPVTGFGLLDMPLQQGGTYTFLMYAAATHAMHAQKILSVEAAYDFSGQTIPLKIDRTQGYALAFEQMMKVLNEAWPVAKYNMVRHANLLGITSVRMPSRRFQNQVIRIDSGPTGNIFQLLSGLGLL